MSEKNEKCIFASEDDCPLESISISCAACMEHGYTEVIKQAIKDYTELGDNFNHVFNMLKTLFTDEEKVLELNVPLDSIQAVVRILNALLGSSEVTDNQKLVYRRLIFLFFSFLIEEFESLEYADPESLH